MNDTDLNFAEHLASRAEAEGLRKAERTRLRLQAAIARMLLGDTEPGEMRVADIVAAAGVAHGTYYNYFADVGAGIETLVGDFATFLYRQLDLAREADRETRASHANYVYARLFRINAGLMRCLLGLRREDSAARKAMQQLSESWNKRVARGIARRRKQTFDNEAALYAALLPTAYALGGMIDDFLTQLYLRQDPALASLAGNDQRIAELLNEIWSYGERGRPPMATRNDVLP